jgi:hypothetical protein
VLACDGVASAEQPSAAATSTAPRADFIMA